MFRSRTTFTQQCLRHLTPLTKNSSFKIPISNCSNNPKRYRSNADAGKQFLSSNKKLATFLIIGLAATTAASLTVVSRGSIFGTSLTEALKAPESRPEQLKQQVALRQKPSTRNNEKRNNSTLVKKISRAQVSEHNSLETGIWVIRERGVYDITEFVKNHPGGERILLAAGRSIDPFWKVFTVHNTPETLELLETYRIGDLEETDDEAAQQQTAAAEEAETLSMLFSAEPELDPSLISRSQRPCNAESSPSSLQTFITPNPLFYVRNHLPVPDVDEREFKLNIEIPGPVDDTIISLSMDDLRNKFPKHTITSTLQCAGNRRKDMHDVKPTKGLLWQLGAISTAEWSGAKLTDVLAAYGYIHKESDEVEHVIFDGIDGYGASIPIHKAANPAGDVILAYEMNGEPIPKTHGFPLRAVIPGNVAARSVKWVNRISMSSDESTSHWQQHDYKGFSPSATLENSDYSRSESIQEMPVQSAIISPVANSTVTATSSSKTVSLPSSGATPISDPTIKTIPVRGYAWSGGGRGIIRVDVSIDGGKTWVDAALLQKDSTGSADSRVPIDDKAMSVKQPAGREWAWTLWEANVPLTAELAKSPRLEIDILCRAVDTSYNTQPESHLATYNVRGVLVNAWHRVPVKVVVENK